MGSESWNPVSAVLAKHTEGLMASMNGGVVQGAQAMAAMLYSEAVEARCLLAMSVVLEQIDPEYANDRAICAWEKAHDVGFKTRGDEEMPLMFKGYDTLEAGFYHGQDWAIQMERAAEEEAWGFES